MKRYAPLLSLTGILLLCQSPLLAAFSPASIQAAITRANILPPGTGLSVSVVQGLASVSTYRNKRANEKDCKIQAIMIAKTILEIAPAEVNSVSVFFYDRNDLSAFDQVNLTAGDIKAFAAGQLDKEQFLASLKFDHHESDDSSRISNLIQASQHRMARRPAEAQYKDDAVQIKVDMESWVPPRDVQYEAVRIAEKVLNTNRSKPVEKVVVTFRDPDGQVADRDVVFAKSDEVKTLEDKLAGALSVVSLSKGLRPTIDVPEGPHADERREFAKRIISLKAAGADTSGIEKDFTTMQQTMHEENEAKIKVRLKKLQEDMSAADKSLHSSSVGRGANAGALSAPELKAAIEASHVLSPGTSTTVAVKDSEAIVATYKAEMANEKDCKIEAVMIAKSVMDAAPKEIASVTVYFYGRNDLSVYDEIHLTAGDIKAFGSGEMTKEQLFASLRLERKRAEDAASMAGAIESSENTPSAAIVTVRGASIDVNVQMPSWVGDNDARYEAVRIAEKVFEANRGKAVQQVRVIFADPDLQVGNREATVSSSTLSVVDASLAGVLSAVAVGRQSESPTEVVDGLHKPERQKLATRILALKEAKVGVQAYVDLFGAIERAALTNDEQSIVSNMARLSAALDNQERTLKALKEKPKESPTASPHGDAPAITGTDEDRWAMGSPPIMESRVWKEPLPYWKEMSNELEQQIQVGLAKAGKDKAAVMTLIQTKEQRLYHGMRFFAQCLRKHAEKLKAAGDTAGEAECLEAARNFDRMVYSLLVKHAASQPAGTKKP